MPRSRARTATSTATAEEGRVDLRTAGTHLPVELPAMVPDTEGLEHAKRRADILQEHLSELVPLLREAIEDIDPASMLRAELQCSLPVIELVLRQCAPASPVTADGEAGRNPWGGAHRTVSADVEGDTELMPQRPFDAERARVAVEHARINEPLAYIEPTRSMGTWTGGVTPMPEISRDDPAPVPSRLRGEYADMVIVDDPILQQPSRDTRSFQHFDLTIDGERHEVGDVTIGGYPVVSGDTVTFSRPPQPGESWSLSGPPRRLTATEVSGARSEAARRFSEQERLNEEAELIRQQIRDSIEGTLLSHIRDSGPIYRDPN